jgi:hypothetical protein
MTVKELMLSAFKGESTRDQLKTNGFELEKMDIENHFHK